MTTEVSEISAAVLPLQPTGAFRRYRFNADEYHRLVDAGALTEDSRVELIEGEIIEMSPIGKRHAACVKRAANKLKVLIGESVIVGVQDPLPLPGGESEPQPDVMLLKPRDDFYETEPPQPADVLLLIEVADSSLGYDRDIKLPLYARAGIAEVWLANLMQDVIEIYTEPKDGFYLVRRIAQSGDTIAPQALSQVSVEVDAVLG